MTRDGNCKCENTIFMEQDLSWVAKFLLLDKNSPPPPILLPSQEPATCSYHCPEEPPLHSHPVTLTSILM
jgi:hypothetical protein